MDRELVAITEDINREGFWICGVVSRPGEFIQKEGFEDKFRVRIATGGDQVHVPIFVTVTFYGEFARQAKRELYLQKELSQIVVHGRLSANPSKDGRRCFIELSADGVKEI